MNVGCLSTYMDNHPDLDITDASCRGLSLNCVVTIIHAAAIARFEANGSIRKRSDKYERYWNIQKFENVINTII